MTKQQELAVLDRAIKELGPNSYLGPWLKAVRAEVAADIRSDIIPTVTPGETATMAAQVLGDAKTRAEEVIRMAQESAIRITTEATMRANQIRQAAKNYLEHLGKQL